MKQFIKLIGLSIFIVLVFFSCRKELIIYETEPNVPGLEASSILAGLLKSVSMNDGSSDNIIDSTCRIKIQLPVTVIVNGIEIIVDSEEILEVIERIFDEFDDDKDVLQIIFPITIVLSDFTEIIIDNQSEFDIIKKEFSCEDGFDDDIECIDFVYPITVSIFDVVTEQTASITINNDYEMFNFLEDIDDDDLVGIDFPISMVLFDGTEISIASLEALETTIDAAKDSCDEDDDNDFDDDDGDDYDYGVGDADSSMIQFIEVLSSCSNWTVDKFELNDDNLEDDYIGYAFNFSLDSTIIVQYNGDYFSGNWSSYKIGLSTIVVIKLPELPEFNASWKLHEIEQNGTEKKIDLRQGENRLRFESRCK